MVLASDEDDDDPDDDEQTNQNLADKNNVGHGPQMLALQESIFVYLSCSSFSNFLTSWLPIAMSTSALGSITLALILRVFDYSFSA